MTEQQLYACATWKWEMKQRDWIAFAIYCGDWGVDFDDKKPDNVPRNLQHWKDVYMPALQEDHLGDCTKDPCTCIRCLVEEWYALADAILKEVTGC